jgi:hypothetical protein
VVKKKAKVVASVVGPARVVNELVDTVTYAPHFWTLVALGRGVVADVGGGEHIGNEGGGANGVGAVGDEAEGEASLETDEELQLSSEEEEEVQRGLEVVADVVVQEVVVQQEMGAQHDVVGEEGDWVRCGQEVNGVVCTKMCKPSRAEKASS